MAAPRGATILRQRSLPDLFSVQGYGNCLAENGKGEPDNDHGEHHSFGEEESICAPRAKAWPGSDPILDRLTSPFQEWQAAESSSYVPSGRPCRSQIA